MSRARLPGLRMCSVTSQIVQVCKINLFYSNSSCICREFAHFHFWARYGSATCLFEWCAAMPRRCGESLIGGSSALAVALSTVRILGPKRCALRFWLRFCVSRTRRCQLLTCSLRAVSVGRRHFGARCDGMLRPPHWQGCKSWAARCDCWRLPR